MRNHLVTVLLLCCLAFVTALLCQSAPGVNPKEPEPPPFDPDQLAKQDPGEKFKPEHKDEWKLSQDKPEWKAKRDAWKAPPLLTEILGADLKRDDYQKVIDILSAYKISEKQEKEIRAHYQEMAILELKQARTNLTETQLQKLCALKPEQLQPK